MMSTFCRTARRVLASVSAPSSLLAFAVGMGTLAVPASSLAFNGLVVTELPPGGDVTIPGEYPIRVPMRAEVLLTGLSSPQSLTLTNQASEQATIHIYATHEKNVRRIKLAPGSSAVYTLKQDKAVRVKVTGADVRVDSVLPLKVQR
jgi:hypothetical protein